jgi:hypothetical protein
MILNETEFRQKMRDNDAIITKILTMLYDQYGANPLQIKELASEGDTEKLYHFAHSIKGAFLNVCVSDVECLGKIEEIARDGKLPESSLVDQATDYISALSIQIKDILDR